MTFLRGCYHQILGPRRQLPKLSNGLCRHAGAYVRLDLHLRWQAPESYVERGNAFALIPGHGILPDCSAAEQPTIEGSSFARHASERGHGTLEGVPDNKLDVVPNALGWRLGPSNSAILPRASRDKRGNGTLVSPSLRERHEGVAARPGGAYRRAVLWSLPAYCRRGERDNSIMSPIAKSLAEEDLRKIASYFAAKSWPARSATATPAPPPKGNRAMPAMPSAEFSGWAAGAASGGSQLRIPRHVDAQFCRQLTDQQGDMPKFMEMLTDSERDAIAHYLSDL